MAAGSRGREPRWAAEREAGRQLRAQCFSSAAAAGAGPGASERGLRGARLLPRGRERAVAGGNLSHRSHGGRDVAVLLAFSGGCPAPRAPRLSSGTPVRSLATGGLCADQHQESEQRPRPAPPTLHTSRPPPRARHVPPPPRSRPPAPGAQSPPTAPPVPLLALTPLTPSLQHTQDKRCWEVSFREC